jgi:hypothetical protein
LKANIFSPLNSSEFVVAIDCVSPSIGGTIYHRNLLEGVYFKNVTEFALTVEDVLDQIDEASLAEHAQLANVQAASLQSAYAPSAHAGNIATFRLDVMFRQHCSWQGRMVWVEQGTEVKFRSFLELVLLLNDIMADCQTDM